MVVSVLDSDSLAGATLLYGQQGVRALPPVWARKPPALDSEELADEARFVGLPIVKAAGHGCVLRPGQR